MKTGQRGLALIKSFEGWFSKPYLDPIGIHTIAYGVTYYLPSRAKAKMTPFFKSLADPQNSSMIFRIKLKLSKLPISPHFKTFLYFNSLGKFVVLIYMGISFGRRDLSMSHNLFKRIDITYSGHK